MRHSSKFAEGGYASGFFSAHLASPLYSSKRSSLRASSFLFVIGAVDTVYARERCMQHPASEARSHVLAMKGKTRTPPSIMDTLSPASGDHRLVASESHGPHGGDMEFEVASARSTRRARLGKCEMHLQLAIGSWLPDETLFSLCSRWHRVSANSVASITCATLFGHPTSGTAHDFPSPVDHFAQSTGGVFGDARTIISQRTVLPFYLPFRTENLAEKAVKALSFEGICDLKLQLGLQAGRLGSSHPLKACPACMAEDAQRFGVPYWHRAHQLPCTWICADHYRALLISTVKSNGIGRFQWCLPDESELQAVLPGGEISEVAASLLVNLALSGSAIAGAPLGTRIDMPGFRAAAIPAMQRMGLVDQKGRWRARRIGAEFCSFLSPLTAVPYLRSLAVHPEAATDMLRRILASSGGATNPMRFCLALTWLFGSWENYWSERHACESTPEQITLRARSDRNVRGGRDGIRKRFLELLEGGVPPTTAARKVGVDPGTGQAWAAAAGLNCGRRPKTLSASVRARVIRALRTGQAKSVIAERAGITQQAVTRILRTEPGLQLARKQALDNKARAVARRAWLNAISSKGVAGVKAARARAPGAYAWLYRNDRHWLESTTRSLPPPPRSSKHADWRSRDRDLSARVEQAAFRIIRSSGRRTSLQTLIQQAPEIRTQLRHLEKMPLTKSALNNALRSTCTAAK